MKINKNLYYPIKITLLIFGIIAIFQVVPYFTQMLQFILDLFKLSDKSVELKFLMICLSIWITCKVIDTITNIIFKLQKLIKEDKSK